MGRRNRRQRCQINGLLSAVATNYALGVRFPCPLYKECHLKAAFLFAFSLLCGLQAAVGQATSWLTDEQARDVAGSAIHSEYPEPCYSTYRNERLESFTLDIGRIPLIGDHPTTPCISTVL